MTKIELKDGTKKMWNGKYVIYDIDYLLDNLAREVYLIEAYRLWRKRNKGADDE